MKQRIYVDTSVIGGCLDQEFSLWSNLFFDEVRQGLKTVVISDLTKKELEKAPQEVKGILLLIPEESVENVFLNDESESLAQNYIQNKVVTVKHIVDAQHIAIATVERVLVLVSWNFKQIVNLDKIHAFNSVNLKLGYPLIEIRSPREVINEKEL